MLNYCYNTICMSCYAHMITIICHYMPFIRIYYPPFSNNLHLKVKFSLAVIIDFVVDFITAHSSEVRIRHRGV